MKTICCIFLVALVACAVAYADIRVIGAGNATTIDTSGYPPEMLKAHALMMQKCTQCHSIERIIVGIQTGVAPITKMSFSKETTRSIVSRMFLKDNSNMTRDEAGLILHYLDFLLDQKMTAMSSPPDGFAVTSGFAVTTTSLPGATIGTAYSQTLAASGGTAPYTWSVSVGALPAGLRLAAATGVISGTPTTAGTASFTVTATDSATPANTATKALSITVAAAGQH